ncbi:hypothetical protein SUGI_1097170 [Cryptomeria japonica]|nr:hypothetical protein SUGI_1097170 [Cryptomeria japonica]
MAYRKPAWQKNRVPNPLSGSWEEGFRSQKARSFFVEKHFKVASIMAMEDESPPDSLPSKSSPSVNPLSLPVASLPETVACSPHPLSPPNLGPSAPSSTLDGETPVIEKLNALSVEIRRVNKDGGDSTIEDVLITGKQKDLNETREVNKDTPQIAPRTPPFNYGLRATGDEEVPYLSIGPSIEEALSENMEVDMGSVELNDEEKTVQWVIVPFKGDTKANLIKEAMKEFGIRKATNKKKTKKHKKPNKPIDTSHLDVDEPFEFKKKRGRPNGSTALSKAQKSPHGQLPK